MEKTKKLIKQHKKLLIILSILIISSVLFAFYVLLNINLSNKKFIFHELKQIPQAQVALLLGAKVYNNGGLSPMMQDRADAAVDLYKNGKVAKILVSGDHGTKDYDEVNTIKKYILKKNVRAEDIFLDHAGFNTYDSFYRARAIFKVESVIVVTQDFHLPRALFIGKTLGLNVSGFSADRQNYGNISGNYIRELPADFKAFLELSFHVKPKFLGSQIPITGDNVKSWD